jgi:hypothetical protein
MHQEQLRAERNLPAEAIQGRYSMRVEHPRGGRTTVENCVSMRAAIARATELIQAGYSIRIWSSAS